MWSTLSPSPFSNGAPGDSCIGTQGQARRDGCTTRERRPRHDHSFFQSVIRADPIEWMDYLRGIDFNHPVFPTTLKKNTTLIRYDKRDRGPIPKLPPFAFFTDPGVSPFHIGTSWPMWEYKRFDVSRETHALVSTASSVSFSPRPSLDGKVRFDRVSRIGGAVQYIISRGDWPTLLYVSGPKHAY